MNPKSANHHVSVGNHPDHRPHTTRMIGRMGHVEEPSDTKVDGFSSILRRYPLALATFALSVVLFITVAAFAVYQSQDPTAFIRPMSAAVLGISSLIGGIVGGRLNQSRSIAASLVYGGMTTALLLLFSLLFAGEGDALCWGMRAAVLPIHLLGGAIARPKPKTPAHTAGKHPSHR